MVFSIAGYFGYSPEFYGSVIVFDGPEFYGSVIVFDGGEGDGRVSNVLDAARGG